MQNNNLIFYNQLIAIFYIIDYIKKRKYNLYINGEKMDNTLKNNPLLEVVEFPRYDLIKSEHFVPAITFILEEAKIEFDKLKKFEGDRTFVNTLIPQLIINEKISKVIIPMSQLFSLMATEEIIKEFTVVQQMITKFYSELSLDEEYYQVFKDYSETEDAKNISGERKRYFDDKMLGFTLSGAQLPKDKKVRFKEINLKLSDLSLNFQNNLLNSVFDLVIDNKDDLAGLPDNVIAAARETAKNNPKLDKEKELWLFNLDMPSYFPFMQYADNDELRKILWKERINQATSKDMDNLKIIDEILTLRKEMAEMLGYKTFAEISLETKMANSPEEVIDFLDGVAGKIKNNAVAEMDEVIEFKKKYTADNSITEILPWEIGYWSNKLKEEKYSYNENEVRNYFKAENCVNGMFEIAGKLFSLKFEEITDIPTYHKDVKNYKIMETDGKLIAYLLVDLYPRTKLKRGGAWMNQFVSSKKDENGERVIPQVGIHCNFTPPTGNLPALLSFDEVQTLFHEFGHSLHGALGMSELSAMSGTHVLWDTVELPSTFMENFVRNKDGLNIFAKHYETGEIIPAELVDKLIKSEDFMKAVGTRRQVALGMFDMLLHHNKEDKLVAVHKLQEEVHKKYSHTRYFDDTYFEAGFAHIFAGGYSAGYYSYMWANILEADAFSLFEEGDDSILDSKKGASFRKNILEMGNSEDMNVLFERFRGRKVSKDALLKRFGIV